MVNFNQELSKRVKEMQHKLKDMQKQPTKSCAGCGKIFAQNEKTVSYDFERYYCFHCDDKRLRA
jgi:hypothetical protein